MKFLIFKKPIEISFSFEDGLYIAECKTFGWTEFSQFFLDLSEQIYNRIVSDWFCYANADPEAMTGDALELRAKLVEYLEIGEND